jgi:hypothetical protein
MIRVTRLADPPVEPIFLDEALNWASVSVVSMQGGVDPRAREQVRDLIPEQRESVEIYTGRVLVAGDFIVTVDDEDIGGRHFLAVQPYRVGEVDLADVREQGSFWLPISPVLSVSQITATAPDGTVSVVDSSVYSLILGEYPRIALIPGQSWPSPLQRQASLTVYCHGGYAFPIGPIQQASTDDLAVVTGSEVAIADVGSPLRFGFEVPSGAAVNWSIFGAPDKTFVTEQVVRAAATIQPGNTDHALVMPGFTNYRVKIQSAAAGAPGAVALSGLGGMMPTPLRLAIRQLVRYYFEHRGNQLYIGQGGFKGIAPSPDLIWNGIAPLRIRTVH